MRESADQAAERLADEIIMVAEGMPGDDRAKFLEQIQRRLVFREREWRHEPPFRRVVVD